MIEAVDGVSYSLLEYSKLASNLRDIFIGIDRHQHYLDEYAPVARLKHQTTMRCGSHIC